MFSRVSRSLTPGLCGGSGVARPSGSDAKTHPVCRPINRALLNHGKGAVMRRWVIGLLLMGVLGGLWPEKAPAIERGLPEYGNGAQNFFAGVVPRHRLDFIPRITWSIIRPTSLRACPGYLPFISRR